MPHITTEHVLERKALHCEWVCPSQSLDSVQAYLYCVDCFFLLSAADGFVLLPFTHKFFITGLRQPVSEASLSSSTTQRQLYKTLRSLRRMFPFHPHFLHSEFFCYSLKKILRDNVARNFTLEAWNWHRVQNLHFVSSLVMWVIREKALALESCFES